MKNLLKVLFIIISLVFNSYTMEIKEKEKETEEVKETEKKSSLYQFFNIEKSENLPEELKDIITQQYGGQWWYLLNTLKEKGKLIESAKFNPQDNLVLYGLSSGIAKLSDLDGNIIKTFNHNKQVTSVAFNPQGNRILTGSSDKTVKLWNLDGDLLQTFQHNGWIRSVAFNPQGNRILTGSEDRTAKLWTLDGKLITTFQHDSSVCSVAFNPQGNKILTGSSNKTAKLWNLDGKLLATFNHDNLYEPEVTDVTFNPHGDKILTGSSDNIAQLWDLNGKLIKTFKHNSWVRSVKFNPQGDRILTGSYDTTAKLWKLDGELITTFRHNNNVVTSVAFSHRGDKILICGLNMCSIWALYNPTLEQLLLRKLIYLYLESEKPSKQIKTPQMLFKKIVDKFKTENVKLDEEELNFVWKSLPNKVQNSFWNKIKQHIKEFGKKF